MEIKDSIHKYLKEGRSWFQRDVKLIKKLTVHHTASMADGTHDQILKSIMSTHADKNGWPGLSYHYMIMPDGTIYQLNNHEDVTWHDTHNYDSLGICIHGYFHAPHDQKPNTKQLISLKFLLDKLCKEHPEIPADMDDVLGHRERSSTACPGNHLFPYVTEYRTKLGDVDWGTPEPEKYDLDTDIPSEIEDKHKLKEYDRYDKHWSFHDLMKDWTQIADDLGRVAGIVEEAKQKVISEYEGTMTTLRETHKDQIFKKDEALGIANQTILDKNRLIEDHLKQKYTIKEIIGFLGNAKLK